MDEHETSSVTSPGTRARLNEIITTPQLSQRRPRQPNYDGENHALAALVGVMADSPETTLQQLVDTAMQLTGAHSAGISILEGQEGKTQFRWHATSGELRAYLNGTMPGDFSPCGVVLDRDATQLMDDPDRYFPYMAELKPRVSEVLLVPFHRDGTPIGTVWVVAHTEAKKFDSEDARVVGSLSRFAECAVQTLMRHADAMQQRQRLLEAENLARQAAEAASKAKDKFMAVLSHELRTPLSPIIMTAVEMETDPRLPRDLIEDVAMIRRNAELQARLIDDLLDVSRVTNGKLHLNKVPTSVHTVVRDALKTVGRDLHEKAVRVELECAAECDTVLADAARLQQSVWNLLKNAAKFTTAGGSVVVRTQNRDSRLIVQVTDTGRGIPGEMLSKIFDPFDQGEEGTNARSRGLGLGLAIARGIIDLHGGTIAAASAGLGKGATFTISLPLCMANVEDLATLPARTKLERALRLLLVEDHEDTAQALARSLKAYGYHVSTATDAKSAAQIASAQPFDLLISDIGLPDASGYELMSELARRDGLRGIAMTGYGMEDDLLKSRAAGFTEHLVKPIDLRQLDDAIRRVAAKR